MYVYRANDSFFSLFSYLFIICYTEMVKENQNNFTCVHNLWKVHPEDKLQLDIPLSEVQRL